jgi:predicted site-specific integrase-resolvase
MARVDELIGISRSTAYREARDGRLRLKKVRGQTYITVASARAWLEGLRDAAIGAGSKIE